MNAPLAAIFDMDGVLIDSYAAHLESWQRAAREFGVEMSEPQFAATFGRTSREAILATWGPDRFTDDEVRDFDRHKEQLWREIIARDMPLMPGARELLQALVGAKFRLAVGSSAPPENVDLILDRLGPRSQFEAVITGADVRQGKPDPQVFLLAAARMRLPPERCVVVEDAVQGVQAARAAGMACVGLASRGRTRESLAAADRVVDRLEELTPDTLQHIIVEHLERIADEEDAEEFVDLDALDDEDQDTDDREGDDARE